MTIEQDFKAVLRRARAWYKGHAKSSNKAYQSDRPKFGQRQNLNVLAEARLKVLRGEVPGPNPIPEHLDPIGEGQWLLDNDERVGNCNEMATVALELCRRCPVLTAHIEALYFVRHFDENGHAFGMARLRGGRDRPNSYTSIQEMYLSNLGKPAPTGLWVIDPWLNIACPAFLYSTRIRQKLEEWERQGKYVVGNPNHNLLRESFDYRGYWNDITRRPLEVIHVA